MSQSLADLPLGSGLRFGVWAVWRASVGDPPGDDLYIVHPQREWRLYTPIHSNGWFNYTTDAGVWMLHFGWVGEESSEQDRSDVHAERFISRQPAGDWPEGRFAEGEWVVECAGHRLTFKHEENDAPLVLWRDRDLWTFGKKSLADCCGG